MSSGTVEIVRSVDISVPSAQEGSVCLAFLTLRGLIFLLFRAARCLTMAARVPTFTSSGVTLPRLHDRGVLEQVEGWGHGLIVASPLSKMVGDRREYRTSGVGVDEAEILPFCEQTGRRPGRYDFITRVETELARVLQRCSRSIAPLGTFNSTSTTVQH